MPHSRVAEPTHDDLLRIFEQPKTVAVDAKVIWFPVSGQDHIAGAESYLRRRLSASSDRG